MSQTKLTLTALAALTVLTLAIPEDDHVGVVIIGHEGDRSTLLDRIHAAMKEYVQTEAGAESLLLSGMDSNAPYYGWAFSGDHLKSGIPSGIWERHGITMVYVVPNEARIDLDNDEELDLPESNWSPFIGFCIDADTIAASSPGASWSDNPIALALSASANSYRWLCDGTKAWPEDAPEDAPTYRLTPAAVRWMKAFEKGEPVSERWLRVEDPAQINVQEATTTIPAAWITLMNLSEGFEVLNGTDKEVQAVPVDGVAVDDFTPYRYDRREILTSFPNGRVGCILLKSGDSGYLIDFNVYPAGYQKGDDTDGAVAGWEKMADSLDEVEGDEIEASDADETLYRVTLTFEG